MRDIRDPDSVGKILLSLSQHQKVPILKAADELSAYAIKDYVSPDCVGRYGRPGDVTPRFEEIQVR